MSSLSVYDIRIVNDGVNGSGRGTVTEVWLSALWPVKKKTKTREANEGQHAGKADFLKRNPSSETL